MEMPDFSKLDLDPNNIGNWPGAIKAIVILVLCAAVLGAGYWFDTRAQLTRLSEAQAKEVDLKKTFEFKQRKAANLEPLKEQLQDMKDSFGNLLRLLPNRTEIEGLLVDISQSGLAAGLEFELFKPGGEKVEEFYAIQPIAIRVTGKYHEFGNFVSTVAALPRIVTQHNIEITPVTKGGKAGPGQDQLVMDMVARTYRYLDEDEIAAREAEAQKNRKGKGKKKRRKKKK